MDNALNLDVPYHDAYKATKAQAYSKVEEHNKVHNPLENNKIHNAAVNLSISMESMKVFLNIKSVEVTQNNVSAQNVLSNIIANTSTFDFLSGKKDENGFSLSSIGYHGKPITELSSSEAKSLISDNGFFSIAETSQRVSSFVIKLAGDNVEALQETRVGLEEGFFKAEVLWGGNLPEISYQTQRETLKIVDEKIAELLKTDAQKEVEA